MFNAQCLMFKRIELAIIIPKHWHEYCKNYLWLSWPVGGYTCHYFNTLYVVCYHIVIHMHILQKSNLFSSTPTKTTILFDKFPFKKACAQWIIFIVQHHESDLQRNSKRKKDHHVIPSSKRAYTLFSIMWILFFARFLISIDLSSIFITNILFAWNIFI